MYDDPFLSQANDPNVTYRKEIERATCIYVHNATTGRRAHVYGHSSAPRDAAVDPDKPFLNSPCELSIPVKSEDEVKNILKLVREIKGHHEFCGEWEDPPMRFASPPTTPDDADN